MVYCYVEFTRSVPVVVQILLWHGVIGTTLPHPRDALSPMEGVYLSNRGFYVPAPVFESGFWIVVAAFLAGIAGTILFRRWAKKRQAETGQIYPVFTIGTAAILGRSEEHTSELQSLMRISYAVFCLNKKHKHNTPSHESSIQM